MISMSNSAMTQYFRKFDIDNNEEYQSAPTVLERTTPLAHSYDYQMGYWMQSFIRLYTPGVYFRACNAFGKLENWQELRSLMEHAIFDPRHPLYGLDYETCSDEDRTRLDALREIALTCCYCGYAFLKRERPNLLPKKERKPLTQKEEKSIRWMIAYYTNSGTAQERAAFDRYKWNFHEIYPRRTPTLEEVEEFNAFQDKVNMELKLKQREEAQRREAERLSKLPEVHYIAAHQFIKDQFKQVFGKEKKFTAIRYPFDFGLFDCTSELPKTQELVVILPYDVRSHMLLRYIAAHFHQKISVINLVGGSHGRRYPLTFNNLELQECCKQKTELSKAQTRELRNEFHQLKSNSSEFFRLEDSKICPLPRNEFYNHILRQFPQGEKPLLDLLGECMGYAPDGWPKGDVFYFYCIEDLIEDGVIHLTQQSEPFDYKQYPPKWILKLDDKYLNSRNKS